MVWLVFIENKNFKIKIIVFFCFGFKRKGVGMCILSFIAVCIYCIVDFFVDRSEQKTEKIEALIQELFGKNF